MEQKPALSLMFYCALILLGSLILLQSAPLLWHSHQQQTRRTALPVHLTDLSHEVVPLPGGGARNRLRSCRYEYSHGGNRYQSQGFSLLASSRYARDLPALLERIRRRPQAWIDPAAPLDAVLVLDPPQSVLTGLLVGILFLHLGVSFTGIWVLKRVETRRLDAVWSADHTLLPDRSPLGHPVLIPPALTVLGLLPLSFLLVPGAIPAGTFALVSVLLYAAILTASLLRTVLAWGRTASAAIVQIGWEPHKGLHFTPPATLTPSRARLDLVQLRESRFSWSYRKMGRADFERVDGFFSLAPYTFKPSSPWSRPLVFLSSAARTERTRMLETSASLCQILAGQSSRHKGRSLLMGLMRKRPDFGLTITLEGSGSRWTYPLPVVFWTSEISR
jgi:hypothetical protein